MKEIESHLKDKMQVEEVVPVRSEKKFIGSVVPKRGHKCFEYNLKTGEVLEAEFESKDAFFPVEGEKEINGRKTIVRKEGCAYVTALNKKNAIKKVERILKTM